MAFWVKEQWNDKINVNLRAHFSIRLTYECFISLDGTFPKFHALGKGKSRGNKLSIHLSKLTVNLCAGI